MLPVEINVTDTSTLAVYMVRADFARYAPAFLAGGYVGIGWLEDHDLSGAVAQGKEALRQLIRRTLSRQLDDEHRAKCRSGWRFLAELTPGAYVVTPLEDSALLRVRQITGEYYYHPHPSELALPSPQKRQVAC